MKPFNKFVVAFELLGLSMVLIGDSMAIMSRPAYGCLLSLLSLPFIGTAIYTLRCVHHDG